MREGAIRGEKECVKGGTYMRSVIGVDVDVENAKGIKDQEHRGRPREASLT